MKKLFLALPFLLAGCQAERVAYQFQPVVPAAVGVAPARPATAETTADATAVSASQLLPEAPTTPALPARRPRWAVLAKPATTPALAMLAVAPAGAEPLARPSLVQRLLVKRLVRQHATAGPARTSENGLGGIGLFAIAVVLAILAGLGALVSLIPGVSFLGGVGLAAGGLVVLFLLYKLLSGGGKKQKPAAK